METPAEKFYKKLQEFQPTKLNDKQKDFVILAMEAFNDECENQQQKKEEKLLPSTEDNNPNQLSIC